MVTIFSSIYKIWRRRLVGVIVVVMVCFFGWFKEWFNRQWHDLKELEETIITHGSKTLIIEQKSNQENKNIRFRIYSYIKYATYQYSRIFFQRRAHFISSFSYFNGTIWNNVFRVKSIHSVMSSSFDTKMLGKYYQQCNVLPL